MTNPELSAPVAEQVREQLTDDRISAAWTGWREQARALLGCIDAASALHVERTTTVYDERGQEVEVRYCGIDGERLDKGRPCSTVAALSGGSDV